MHKKFLWLFIPLMFCGCSGSQISISDYYTLAASSTSGAATTTYTLVVVNSANANGYAVNQGLPTLTYALTSIPKDNSTALLMPRINFTSAKVDYTVVQDTQGVIGTWSISSVTSGINFSIPQGTGAQSATVTLNNVATSAIAQAVFAKIGTVTASQNVDGTYAFKIALSTGLGIRANVTLTGTDDRGKEVSLPISTTLLFTVSS